VGMRAPRQNNRSRIHGQFESAWHFFSLRFSLVYFNWLRRRT
jgi:hypothetical protein